MSDASSSSNASAPLTREQMMDKAREERRFGLLILENKTGSALAGGVPHFRTAADL